MQSDDLKEAAAVFLIALFLYLAVLALFGSLPFHYDEGIYALMIHEFSRDPWVVMPTVTGEDMEFKPPLFTWVYAAPFLLLGGIGLAPELAMRMPSAFFAAGAACVVFLIAKKLYGRDSAILSAALFMTSPILLFASATVMMEALSVLLVVSAIYLYISDRRAAGILCLFFLAMTKWLYGGAVILFVAAHFIRDKKLPAIALSFLSLPAGLLAYLALAWMFGDYGSAASNLTLDIVRTNPEPLSGLTVLNYILRLGTFFFSTFPLSLLFVYFAFFGKYDRWGERPLLALGALGLLMPLSRFFIFWYAIISVPALAVFTARRMSSEGNRLLIATIAAAIILLNLLAFAGTFEPGTPETREAAAFMKGKEAQFLETNRFFPNWLAISERYLGTDKEYLLLEQNNPSLLFYRFNDSEDYGFLKPLFAAEGDVPECGLPLVIHKYPYSGYVFPYSVPPCMELHQNGTHYDVYLPAPSS
ncbi:MAG: glycosyltransferase family 39 protein [Candidatus Micrarchaeota archaeon]